MGQVLKLGRFRVAPSRCRAVSTVGGLVVDLRQRVQPQAGVTGGPHLRRVDLLQLGPDYAVVLHGGGETN